MIDLHPSVKAISIDFSFLVSDVAKEDLLSHFDECIDFIENALINNKQILVHW